MGTRSEATRTIRKERLTKTKDQAELLRSARRALGMTNAQLADALGKSEAALLAWLAPKQAGKHRVMPKGSKLLLERLLAEHRSRK